MKLITLLIIVINAVILPFSMPAQSPVLLRTFNNPTPEAGDFFGAAMAALGNDRVLIGSPNYLGNPTPPTNTAAVYVFHTNGTLLTTFNKPPAVGGEFGNAITTLGNDQVVIGSKYGMAVSLFTTNGSLVTTITAPQSQSLGPAVVAVGTDKLLIGAPYANQNNETYDVYGAAYLYSTNGTLLMTFDNPSTGTVSGLGYSAVAFGSDRVLIGASGDWPGAGAAYLFNINGTLLMTFTNPASGAFDYFGRSIAAVGTDRVLVGSPAEGANAEEVYLFNTNGTLLLTITNPTPAADDWFGHRIAVLGNDRVVIGAPDDDTTGLSSGSAYVFSLNGTLLATINNPAPGIGDRFGLRVAAFGNDGVIIGAPQDNGVGSAYLFSIPAPATPPSLTIQRTTTNTVVVSWPSTATGFVLQQNTNSVSSVNWSNITGGIQNDGSNNRLVVNPNGQSRFYRLISP
jgi:hypothetical protein